MTARIFSLFTSYDLFGKSVPGAILLLGLGSFLPIKPKSVQIPISEPTTLNFVMFILSLLILGLMFGQSVHTLADNIEKAFRWVSERIVHTVRYLRIYFPNLKMKYDILIDNSEIEENWENHFKDWRNGLAEWGRKRFWGIYDTFVSHRYLFAKSIAWNFDDEIETVRWNSQEKGDLYDEFAEKYNNLYEEDIRQKTPDEIETVYPLVTSRLRQTSATEHQKFQSIYSFCRSMWVVFFMLSVGYSIIFYGGFIVDFRNYGYEPIIWILPSQVWNIILLFTFSFFILFLDASGTYKRHFVEYLIADFANLPEEQGDRKEDQIQTTLGET